MRLSAFNALAVAMTLTSSVEAFWRMPCRSRSGVARVDPLVDFGAVSGHVHAIHGSSGFSETATTDDLLNGDCTSCGVSEDKSAYWTPAIYFKHSSGAVELVEQVGGMLAYYLLYANAGNTSLSAFPKNFQMIAGDTFQRNFSYPIPDLPKSNWVGNMTDQAFLRQAALGFNCLNYGIAPEGSLYRHFLPDKAYLDANCKDGVRFELMFPSCWNGVDVDSTDHKSHVAYPSEVMTGTCPEGFETRLVSLFYETIWNTYAFNGVDGEFVIANGDPTGFGYHGDFIMGWDESFLQDAVDTCTNLSGQVEDCPLFTIQSDADSAQCNFTMPAALENEDVLSAAELPGNPLIVGGPAYAMAAQGAAKAGSSVGAATSFIGSIFGNTPTTNSAAPVPTLSHSDGVVLASTDTYVPGAVFAQATISGNAGYVSSSSEPATTPAPEPTSVDTASYFATSWTTVGSVVSEVLWVEEVVTVTASETATVTMAPGRKRHLHQHAGLGRVH